MSKVAIVTDSTTNLPKEIMEKYGIRSAPAVIIWSGEELRDAIDISAGEFYARLAKAEEIPTTSQATPADFKEIYDELLAKGHDILAITISSKLSGMYASAVQAQKMFKEAAIEVIDSLTGAMALGLPIIKIAEAAQSGASLQECKQLAEKLLKNVGLLLVPETLEFLHRGGRIGGAQRFMATALNFKPILEVVDGAFEGVERVRTHQKALSRVVELIEARQAGKPVHLAAVHANAPEAAAKLIELAKGKMKTVETMLAEVSPAVGVHLGPGTAGLAYMGES